jgi:hypothetical protein
MRNSETAEYLTQRHRGTEEIEKKLRRNREEIKITATAWWPSTWKNVARAPRPGET